MTMTPFSDDTRNDALGLIKLALIEDIGMADLVKGSCLTTDSVVPLEAKASAAFVSRDYGVVCGLEVCKAAIETYAPGLEMQCELQDGDPVEPRQTIAVLTGDAHLILVIERTCLNFMCRLSGISTLARRFSSEVEGTGAKVLDTRKTAPGWRRLEKYAVACGGGHNHRMGLFDAVMIKDNHLAFYQSMVDQAAETIPSAIAKARNWIMEHAGQLPNGEQTVLQLEVDTLEQLKIALPAGPDIILLDNMNNDELCQAVAIRNDLAPNVLLEASGGVNLETIKGIAQTGVERISVGAITHSAPNFDIGLDWRI